MRKLRELERSTGADYPDSPTQRVGRRHSPPLARSAMKCRCCRWITCLTRELLAFNKRVQDRLEAQIDLTVPLRA